MSQSLSETFFGHLVRSSQTFETLRLSRITAAQRAYDGEYDDALKSSPLEKADDNVKPNLARLIVDKSATFLVGSGVRFSPADSDENTDLQKKIEQLTRFNQWDALSMKIAQSGGVSGHTFVKLVPSNPQSPKKTVKWVLLDSASVSVDHEPDDISQVRKYLIEFSAYDTQQKLIEYRQTIERSGSGWTIIDSTRQGQAKEFIDGEAIVWPYPFPPIVDCQNRVRANEYYGASDLEQDVLHVIRRIHFTLSNTARLNRLHAHPRTVGKGFRGEALNVAPDRSILIPGGAELEFLEAHGDIAGSLSLYRTLYDLLFLITSVPPVAMTKLESIGAISGIALQVLYAPLMELTRAKRASYGPMFEALVKNSLWILGEPELDLKVEWLDPLPRNEKELREVLKIDAESGWASNLTIQQKLGYNPEKESENLSKQHDDQIERQSQLASTFLQQDATQQPTPPSRAAFGRSARP